MNLGHRRRHAVIVGVWCIADQWRLLLHVHVRNHVIHGLFFVGLHYAGVIKSRRLMRILVGCKRLGMLGLHGEWVDVLKEVGAVRTQGMGVKGMVERTGGNIVAGVQGTLRGREGERSS